MATSLDVSARWAGQHRWFESRLFEIVGGWVPSTGDVAPKLMFDRHSHHHAWRAGQWWDRLPVLADVERDGLCRPADPRLADVVGRLATLESTVERLAGLCRVALPRLLGAYTTHLSEADAVSDGSARRTLEIVTADLVADWREGELALHDHLLDGAAVAQAAATVQALETMVVTPLTGQFRAIRAEDPA